MNMLTILAQQQQQPSADEIAAIMATFFIVLMFFLLITLGINILICVLLYMCQSRIPQEHRSLEPGLIFLLLIPLFNVIWNYFVFQRIPDSFRRFFAAHGVTDVGDCGRGVGLWFAICVTASIIPCVNYLAGPAALVLLIIFLIKAFELKARVQSMVAAPGGPPGTTPPFVR